MRLFFALFAAILSVSPYLSAQPAGKKIVILHTNDLHSHITGCAPESDYTPLIVNDDNTRGGFARIASIFKEEKGGEGEITLILDGGDFLMGTLFQGVELTTGFQLPLMKKMGYDVVAIGNHEFDWGPDKLAEIINSSLRGGEIPQLMLSNAVFDPVDQGDDRLAALFDKGAITRKTVIEREGVKIGFFSILGKVADSNAAFAPPVTFADQVKTAIEMTKQLEGEGCDIIICLSHSGVATDKRGRLRGEDYKLAKKVKGIDVVISGHTHTTINKPLIVNGVPIVQTGAYGRNVGRLELILRDGEIRVSDYRLIAVDDRIRGDSAVNRLVETQKERVSYEILAPLGLEYDTKIAETGFLLSCDQSDVSNSNIGRMVADAIYSYVNNHDPGGTDIAMVAAGVIRDDIVPGAQTASDIFRVMSMGMGEDDLPGYPLSKVFLTGKELKSVLEVLLFSSASTPENYCYYSGLKADIDLKKLPFRKVRKIVLEKPDGSVEPIDISKKNNKLYSVSASAYLLASIGIIKEMTFGLVKVEPKDSEGRLITDISSARVDIDPYTEGVQEGKEWLAIIEYLSSMSDVNGNGIPDIDDKYR